MTAAGFERVERRPVERIVHEFVGREVLDDPFLQKNSTSQLILLTDEAYADGLRLIEKTLTEAEEKGKRVTFPVILLYSRCLVLFNCIACEGEFTEDETRSGE